MIRSVAVVVLWLAVANPNSAQQPASEEFGDWLMGEASAIEFDQSESRKSVGQLVALARAARTLGRRDEARGFFEQARVLDRNSSRPVHYTLFAYAVEADRMDAAKEIAEASGTESLLDRYDRHPALCRSDLCCRGDAGLDVELHG